MSLPLSSISSSNSRSDRVAVLLVARRDEATTILRTLRERGCAVETVPLAPLDERSPGDTLAGITRALTDASPAPESVSPALLRLFHGQPAPPAEVHHFGDVTVDVPSRRVTRQEKELALSTKEFDLLIALLRARGAVLTRSSLMRDVWRTELAQGRTLDSHVCSLRRKIEHTPSRPRHILTIAKVGFRLDR